MESATPKKFRSNLLAALDVKPGLDGLENYNPLLTPAKRKQTPGSPDPRQPKRVADAIRSNIPGLEDLIGWCSGVINSTLDFITLLFSNPDIAATAINGGFTKGSPSRVWHTLQ